MKKKIYTILIFGFCLFLADSAQANYFAKICPDAGRHTCNDLCPAGQCIFAVDDGIDFEPCDNEFNFEAGQTDDFCLCGDKIAPADGQDHTCNDLCPAGQCILAVEDGEKTRECGVKIGFESNQIDDYCLCGSITNACEGSADDGQGGDGNNGDGGKEATSSLQLQYPTINIPGIGETTLSLGMDLGQLIAWLYYFIITISGFAAFIMLIWGGIQWLTSAGNPTKMGEARDRIGSALLGIVIILASWLILRTINPDLTIIKLPGLPGT